MRKRCLLFTFLILPLAAVYGQQNEQDVTVVGDPSDVLTRRQPELSGTVTELQSGNPVAGATVFVENRNTGTTTDSAGHYSIRLPVGRHTVVYQFIGYESDRYEIVIYSDGSLDVALPSKLYDMDEVIVKAEGDDYNVVGSVTGIETLSLSDIEELPKVLGGADVVNTLKLLPGVNSVGEGASGFNVRGGRSDQNLVLLDGAPLYNASHVLGLFSVFNPDVVENFSLFKGHIPARYGGRLSSVLNVSMKKEQIDEFKLRGGIGTAAGRLSMELPFNKTRSSLLLAGRSTYAGWLLSLADDQDLSNSSASFYDGNLNLNHRIDEKNRVFFSFYGSNDRFRYADRFGYTWSNRMANGSWRTVLSDNLSNEFSATYGLYRSSNDEPTGSSVFTLDNGIRYYRFKNHLVHALNERHTLNGGIEWNTMAGQPETLAPYDHNSSVIRDRVEKEHARTISLYAGDEIEISDHFLVEAGIRYTLYQQIGPDEIFRYRNERARTAGGIVDTTFYGGGDVITSYGGIEPRVSARLSLGNQFPQDQL